MATDVPELNVIDTSDRTVISLTDAIPTIALEDLRTRLELGALPAWLDVDSRDFDPDDINGLLSHQSTIAGQGSGGAHVSFKAPCVGDTPREFVEAVEAVEQGEIPLEDVQSAQFPLTWDDAHLLVRGTVNEAGELMSTPRVSLIYEGDCVEVSKAPTLDNGDEVEDGLELSHNEVVSNASANMNWVSEMDMRRTRTVSTEEDWLEFLFATSIEGQITDGLFENEAPPFDYTRLLDSEQGRGRLLYYAYRFNGWDYDEAQLESDLEQLTEQYADGAWLII